MVGPRKIAKTRARAKKAKQAHSGKGPLSQEAVHNARRMRAGNSFKDENTIGREPGKVGGLPKKRRSANQFGVQ